MCGRFVINTKREEIVETFAIDDVQFPAFKPIDNIPPGTHIPIIYQSETKRQLSSAYWGLVPSWAKDKTFASHTFNARSETLSDKPSFREAYKYRRCLIPASAYYEWAKVRVNGKIAGKQPFEIRQSNQALFAFAGLYEYWMDSSKGEQFQSCTIITREAYPSINHIHPRMPVIMPAEQYQTWLDAKTNDFPMLNEDELAFYPIDNKFGTRNNNFEFDF